MSISPRPSIARSQTLVDWLAAEGRIEVAEVASRLGVAPETVRRDLRALEEAGKLQRVHGGAVPVPLSPPASVNANAPDRDHALARLVWDDLPRQGTILLSAGRLTLALAEVITDDPPPSTGLTMITNSLDAAVLLSKLNQLSVYNIGGTVSRETRAQEGDWALTELRRIQTDVCVVCPGGITLDGLSQATPAAAAVSRAEVAAGRRVVAMADASVLGRAAFVQFAGLDAVDALFVAGGASSASLQPFQDRGLSVVSPPLDGGE